jgi:FlaA1/EpsC-like NDP-sugar epimerase
VAEVAEVLIGEREIEMVDIGIRPGEKVHEILVSEDESLRTRDLGDYFVIKPQLPEFGGFEDGLGPRGEFSSADAVVTGRELIALLAEAAFIDPATGQVQPAPRE